MGTQTGWQPDWGWGELDLTRALAERIDFSTATVPSYSARFFRADVANAGDRATLVWNRRGTECLTTGCQANVLTLSNLDLQQLDPATGSIQAQSNSAIDNVEQVRSPSAGPAIYKVTATSNVDGLVAEPFALAAADQVMPLATPQPAATIQVSKVELKPGDTATVTTTARNPSPDLTAENAQLRLNVPAGLEIVSGAQTQALGTLAVAGTPGDSATAVWTVRATADGAGELTATASASRYGETFSSSGSAAVTVDGTPPIPTVAVPTSPPTTNAIPVAWSAIDSGVGVDHYDVDVWDGTAFVPWFTATNATSATYQATAGRQYRFRVRAADRFGNLSSYAVSDPVAIRDALTTGTNPPGPTGGGDGGGPRPANLAKPRLRVASVKRHARRLVVAGTTAGNAHSRIRLEYTARVARRIVRAKTWVVPHSGRFRIALRLSRLAQATKRGRLALSYPRDSVFEAETLRVAVRARR